MLTHESHRRKAVWGAKRTIGAALVLAALGFVPSAAASSRHAGPGSKAHPGQVGAQARNYRLDDELTFRAARLHPASITRVIVTLVPGAELPPQFEKFVRGGKLDIINGRVLELPNGLLKQLAAHPNVFRVHHDRPVGRFNYRTSVTVGAATAQNTLGLTGAGVGVAIVDSGVATWHDDLTTGDTSVLYPYGNQRVAKFVDFVNGRSQPYDDNGHGSHVAGTVLGNGYDSSGQKTGMAPGASLVALKVLDAGGKGTISNIIAALDWVAANGRAYNIRVVNLSIGAGIRESFWTDPLTLACKAITDRGIVVVAAAGNLGKNAAGHAQWGGITAPANAPWVLSVGASSTMGTMTRNDDTMASFSSRGPTPVDFNAKPDLVAPGVGTASLAVPGSAFYTGKAQYLLKGTRPTASMPYLALSGTSMAAPVVSGSVALMLQANPALTPNLVKAILQYTAQPYPGYKALEQGAGFLNTLGAVRLARFYATAGPDTKMPVQKVWSRHLLWGTHMITGGYINPQANAWAANVVWGSAASAEGDNIVWGSMCPGGCDNIVWGNGDADGDNIVWGSVDADGDNIVWGAWLEGDNIVWGDIADDNIVWGSDCGGADCDNIVWGSVDSDNIVWGSVAEGDNIVWGSSGGDNMVWGTNADDADVTWGSDSGDTDASVVYDDSASEPAPDPTLEFGDPSLGNPGASTTGGL